MRLYRNKACKQLSSSYASPLLIPRVHCLSGMPMPLLQEQTLHSSFRHKVWVGRLHHLPSNSHSMTAQAKVESGQNTGGENQNSITFPVLIASPPGRARIGYTRDFFVLWSRYHSSHTHPKSMAASTKLPRMPTIVRRHLECQKPVLFKYDVVKYCKNDFKR